MTHQQLLRPERLRRVERPFGWLPCRLLQGDLLRQMSVPAKLLYMHLALAADRRGLSYWGDQRICHHLGISAAELQQARSQLVELDLIAFDGRVYQLLSLPEKDTSKPLRPGQRRPSPIQHPDQNRPARIPEHARLALGNILGREFLP